MRILRTILNNLAGRPRTEAFPFGAAETPDAYRGRVEVEAGACVGCSTCAQVCVSDAIDLIEEEDGVRLTVWHCKCTFCGLCAYYCPTDAITVTNDWNLAHENARKFAMSESILATYQVCVDCGGKLMVPREAVMAAAVIGHERHTQREEPRCESCRRVRKARQIAKVQI